MKQLKIQLKLDLKKKEFKGKKIKNKIKLNGIMQLFENNK